MYNPERVKIFRNIYMRELKVSVDKNPEDYTSAKNLIEGDTTIFVINLANKMVDSIAESGIRTVNINSNTFKRTCKKIGIHCTYKAIEAYLKEF